MNFVRVGSKVATVELTRAEVLLTLRCTEETFEVLDEWDIQTRSGATMEEARDFYERVKLLLEHMQQTAAAVAKIELSNIDVLFLANAIGEARQGVGWPNIPARLGASEAETDQLKQQVCSLLFALDPF